MMDMIRDLHKKENNLFQSSEWLSFQEIFGREIVQFKDCAGVKIPLVKGKSFVWIQKGPNQLSISNYQLAIEDKNVVFVRVEPSAKEGPLQTLQGSVLREVTEKSLLSGQKSPKATRVLDVSKSEEEILGQMKSKTRYNIRLSAKKGVKVRISNDPKDFDVFYELLLSTAGKDKGYAPHEKKYYQKMLEILGPKNIAKLFIAEFKGKPLAGILVSFYGGVATYLHGGSSEEHRELMAPYLCQWEAIKYARENGQKIYDFWGVAETDDPNDPWAGITRFKEGFGGEKVIFAGTYDLVLNKFWYNILTIAAKIKHILK